LTSPIVSFAFPYAVRLQCDDTSLIIRKVVRNSLACTNGELSFDRTEGRRQGVHGRAGETASGALAFFLNPRSSHITRPCIPAIYSRQLLSARDLVIKPKSSTVNHPAPLKEFLEELQSRFLSTPTPRPYSNSDSSLTSTRPRESNSGTKCAFSVNRSSLMG
jgi:hypothetical protein